MRADIRRARTAREIRQSKVRIRRPQVANVNTSAPIPRKRQLHTGADCEAGLDFGFKSASESQRWTRRRLINFSTRPVHDHRRSDLNIRTVPRVARRQIRHAGDGELKVTLADACINIVTGRKQSQAIEAHSEAFLDSAVTSHILCRSNTENGSREEFVSPCSLPLKLLKPLRAEEPSEIPRVIRAFFVSHLRRRHTRRDKQCSYRKQSPPSRWIEIGPHL